MEKKIQNSPAGVTQEQTPLGAVVYENGVPSNEKAYAKGARKIEADREANGDAGTAPNDQLNESQKLKAGELAQKQTEKETAKAAKEAAKATKEAESETTKTDKTK